jgi:ABC-type antimicrobial peptide transport system permease subunit
MALGAARADVLGLMLKMGARLVLVGLVIGGGLSVASSRLLRSQLFGIEPADPIAYAAVVVLLGLVAFAACYIPARRAARVDPMLALRQE